MKMSGEDWNRIDTSGESERKTKEDGERWWLRGDDGGVRQMEIAGKDREGERRRRRAGRSRRYLVDEDGWGRMKILGRYKDG